MTYRFDNTEFDPASGELRRDGRSVRLEPQPSRALALLLDRAGQVVSRDEVKAAVWPDETHVDFDRGLAYCLSQIRSALGEGAEQARFIETLPRRGFRFTAPVERVRGAPPVGATGPDHRRLRWGIGVGVAAAAIVGAMLVQLRSAPPRVAVAVFDNETGVSDYDRFVGTTSDLVTERLSKIDPARLGVIGNAAAVRRPRTERDLAKIAEETRAAYVVLAQLQSRDTEMHFLVHLIRLDDGTHLWTERLRRPAGETAGLDAAVADAVERAVRRIVLRSAG